MTPRRRKEEVFKKRTKTEKPSNGESSRHLPFNFSVEKRERERER